MTEGYDLNGVARCFATHRKLFEYAASLSRKLTGVHGDADLLHLGGSCMRIAAHDALQSRDTHQTLRSWRECALAERQIRLATFHALRDGCIDKEIYDDVFELASRTARIREDERLRLRRQLHQLQIV